MQIKNLYGFSVADVSFASKPNRACGINFSQVTTFSSTAKILDLLLGEKDYIQVLGEGFGLIVDGDRERCGGERRR